MYTRTARFVNTFQPKKQGQSAHGKPPLKHNSREKSLLYHSAGFLGTGLATLALLVVLGNHV